MRTLATATILAAATALVACSPSARNESAEAANVIGTDVSTTTRNAIDDVDAATDRALGSAERSLDNAGQDIERGADRAGAAIDNTADRARDDAGEALIDAGNELQDR